MEKPQGDLVIDFRGRGDLRQMGSMPEVRDAAEPMDIAEFRISVHPSLDSQCGVTTIKATKTLTSGEKITTVLSTKAVKSGAGFCPVVAARSSDVDAPSYDFKGKPKIVHLGSVDDDFTPCFAIFLSAPGVRFKPPASAPFNVIYLTTAYFTLSIVSTFLSATMKSMSFQFVPHGEATMSTLDARRFLWRVLLAFRQELTRAAAADPTIGPYLGFVAASEFFKSGLTSNPHAQRWMDRMVARTPNFIRP